MYARALHGRSFLFVIALLALAGCETITSQFSSGPSSVVVGDARGISQGGQVRVHGVNVGRVTGITVVPEGARIDFGATVPVDFHAGACGTVRSDGLAGAAYLHIDPGSGETPLEGPLAPCDEPTFEAATAASIAELAGLLEDLRRYVATLESGERALCTVTSAPPAAAAAPEPQTTPPGAPAVLDQAPTEPHTEGTADGSAEGAPAP